jgi:hypothetical protein
MLKSTHCKDCGVDTTKEGFVNRIPTELNPIGVECYICGMCSDTQDAIADDSNRKASEWYEYQEERIKEIDAKYPEAKGFRETLNVLYVYLKDGVQHGR